MRPYWMDDPEPGMPLIQEPDEQVGENQPQPTVPCWRATFHLLFVTIPVFLWDGCWIFIFVLLLTPGFFRFWWFYVSCGRKVRKYKNVSCRNTLDIYGYDASNGEQPERGKPVLVFFPGGAWLIGYKMWGALTAKALVPFGILVVIADYRNYPWGTVPQMVEDINDALQWTLDNCESFGGDRRRLVLLGQSAGGHLCACTLLRKALLQSETGTEGFLPTDIAGFVSLSAPFDLTMMTKTFSRHGLGDHFVAKIFGNQTASFDPQALVHESNESSSTGLPPIAIFHGTRDKTVPCNGSSAMVATLRDAGVDVKFSLYEGWSHTDPILEGPMDADHRFHRDLFELIREWTGHEQEFDETNPACKRLCPHFLLQAGRWSIPF